MTMQEDTQPENPGLDAATFDAAGTLAAYLEATPASWTPADRTSAWRVEIDLPALKSLAIASGAKVAK